MLLIDASWWFGGNRTRGIGRYIDVWLRQHAALPQDRIWLVPQTAPDDQVHDLTRRYGGQSVRFPTHQEKRYQHQAWRELTQRYKLSAVWIVSPFERPWSLLTLSDSVVGADWTVRALVFDLLPLQFERAILQTWPEEEQREYRQRLDALMQADELLAISPWVRQEILSWLHVPEKQVNTLEFGLQDDWVTIPDKVDEQPVSSHPMAVAITGGEWRKNVPGMLRYLSQLPDKELHLYVICRLSPAEMVWFRQLSRQLRVYKRVHWLGEVDEPTKWTYLLQAEQFWHFSYGEGLGIPLLEATRAAVPRVLISRHLERQGVGAILPRHYEVALDPPVRTPEVVVAQ